MSVSKLEEIAARLAPRARLIGLDLGEKTIGMAVSDSRLAVASPIGTIRRRKLGADAAALFAAMDAHEAGGLVIGLPVNMDGSEGPRAQSARTFARNILNLRDLPIAFWDERMSTLAVERAMIEADRSRAKRARSIDTAAAAYILQGALDALRYGSAAGET